MTSLNLTAEQIETLKRTLNDQVAELNHKVETLTEKANGNSMKGYFRSKVTAAQSDLEAVTALRNAINVQTYA